MTGIFIFFPFFPLGASEEAWKIRVKQPFTKNGLHNLLVAFKGLLTSNYPAAYLALRATVMSLGYQRIVQLGGRSCAVALLTGDTETSKTTVLKTCISITGNAEAQGELFGILHQNVYLMTKLTYLSCDI